MDLISQREVLLNAVKMAYAYVLAVHAEVGMDRDKIPCFANFAMMAGITCQAITEVSGPFSDAVLLIEVMALVDAEEQAKRMK